MSVEVLINIMDVQNDPSLDGPALVALPTLPAVGDCIHFKVHLREGKYDPEYRNVVIEVKHRQFSIDKDWVQPDCLVLNDGRKRPALRTV